ncbi:hypothetical protein XM82_004934, partial [Salmonella enterica subsp. enterica serovar Haifa]|nr:hypothetical protein [Salmonella enterica subsp. enterica serovar Haifa]
MAGVLVNLALPDTAGAARLLMLTFAGVTVLGVFVARGASWGIGVRSDEEEGSVQEPAPRGVPDAG